MQAVQSPACGMADVSCNKVWESGAVQQRQKQQATAPAMVGACRNMCKVVKGGLQQTGKAQNVQEGA